MKFLAVDNEEGALRDLQSVLKEVAPDSQISAFSVPQEALLYGKNHLIDVAFLDIEMGRISGLVLAKKLKDLNPYIQIVFVTGHREYAVDAFSLRASGYLLKPVRLEDVRKELAFIKSNKEHGNILEKAPGKVVVKTFGGFDIFANDEIIAFPRAKSKEILAYLVDRKGSSVTTKEACAVLFEDEPYDEKQSSYFRLLVSALKKTLAAAGIEDILIRTKNSLAVDTNQLDCDSYRFLDGDPAAVNSYHSDYMISYSWAEFSVGSFESKV